MWIQNSATPDGATVAFMAFSADVPTRVFDRSRMIELGEGTGDAFNGMVFTYDFEALTITRWQLSETLEPTPGEVISLANEGVSPWWKNAFDTETRAFNLPVLPGTGLYQSGRRPRRGDRGGLPVAFHDLKHVAPGVQARLVWLQNTLNPAMKNRLRLGRATNRSVAAASPGASPRNPLGDRRECDPEGYRRRSATRHLARSSSTSGRHRLRVGRRHSGRAPLPS